MTNKVANKPPALKVENLRASYSGTQVLNGLTFTLNRGEVLALLGPNGAGKTTTIKCILGIIKPTGGRVLIHGQEQGGASRGFHDLGWVPQQPTVDPQLTGREALYLYGRLYGLTVSQISDQLDVLINLLDLRAAIDHPVKYYSGGTRKKLEIATALLHNPDILILDEPTSGLDIFTRITLWNIIRTLKSDGRSVLLTTHYLDEAEALAERIIFLHEGTILSEGTSEELKERYGWSLIRMRWDAPHSNKLTASLPRLFQTARIINDGSKLTVEIATCEPTKTVEQLLKSLKMGKVDEPSEIEIRPPHLEQVFIRISGQAFDPTTGRIVDLNSGNNNENFWRGALDCSNKKQGAERSSSGLHKVQSSSEPSRVHGNMAPTVGRSPKVSFFQATLYHAYRWLLHTRRDLPNQLALLAQPIFW